PAAGDCAKGLASCADGSLPADGGANSDAPNGADTTPPDDGAVLPADACAPPFNTAEHCGACFTQCTAPSECRLGDGGSYACGPPCSPLSNCQGICANLSNDPLHCGACGKPCASGLCSGSTCQGSVSGDVVYIGHDYFTTSPGTAQARLLSNAVFMPF